MILASNWYMGTQRGACSSRASHTICVTLTSKLWIWKGIYCL